MMQIRRCLSVFIVITLVMKILIARSSVDLSMVGMDIVEQKELRKYKMVEQAFRVAEGSKLYVEYFEAHAEKQKMHDLARLFFEKHDLINDGLGYRMIEPLALQLTPEQKEKYRSQLKKLEDANGICYFKKYSPMYQEWLREVASKVDFNVIDKLWCWYWPYINQGSYALWHHGDELYGYLSDKHKEKIELSDYMKPIKMSEYYAVQEERHEER
jgi:hypothetical protein